MTVDIKTYVTNFKDWLKTGSGDAADWTQERDVRLAWYQKHIIKDRVRKTSREEFAKLIKDLWAVNIWRNKDYKVEKLLADNGLEKLREELAKLIKGSDPIEIRWDAFRASIKGLGPAMMSEILTFCDPHQYALINLKPYSVLPELGYSINYVTSGTSYRSAVGEIGKLKKLLSQNGFKDPDFIQTDFFIAYLFYEVFHLQYKRRETTPGKKSGGGGPPLPVDDLRIDDHESAEAVLLKLGNLLGYDTYTADAGRKYQGQRLGELATLENLPPFANQQIMESAENVDVLWLKDEWPEYFFEVEHTTGVTTGLLRIYQAEKLNSKYFILGPTEVLKRYEREVVKAPFKRIKDKYRFRSYDELREMYLSAAKYRGVYDKFLK